MKGDPPTGQLPEDLPEDVLGRLRKDGISVLRNAQRRAVECGLLKGRNILVCTPTASGKTLIAELAAAATIIQRKSKVVYVVPLKALAQEKFRDFQRRYNGLFRVALSIGDLDSDEARLEDRDLIVCTQEKLDSMLRHKAPWATCIGLLVVDEIHLINDPGRGPTLEILITMLRQLLPSLQVLGLSATIGNPQELAAWLGSELIEDSWRPVELKKGILCRDELEFY